MRRSLTGLAIACCAVLLSAWAWSELYLHSQNTLCQNGHWVSSKQRMQLHLVGAVDFLETRQPLAGDRLDLGTWSGFNEVLLNRAVEPRSIGLRFQLEERAHLSVLFARDAAGYAGLRFSRNADFASGFFRASPTGRFEDFRAFEFDGSSGSWHAALIELDQQGGVASVDGGEVARFEGALDGPQTLGFRSGYQSARVDDIEIELASGERIHESFTHVRGRPRALLFFTLATLIFSGAIAGVVWLRGRGGPVGRAPGFAFVLSSGLLALLGGGLLAFDSFYWSANYFYSSPGVRPSALQGIPLAVEKLRETWLQERLPAWIGDQRTPHPLPEPFIEDAIVQRGRPPRGPSEEYSFYSSRDPQAGRFIPFDRIAELPRKGMRTLRIVFIGSSQTWGAGAESSEGTFVARTHQRLQALFPSRSVETLNLSVNGSSTYARLPVYMQISEFVKPDLVVINFGNNDPEPGSFERNLRAFTEWNASIGADTILLREANSLEHPGLARLAVKHDRIDAVGEAAGVPVLDLHGFVNGKQLVDSGFLWWDYVHFSAYGHERVAQWLVPQIEAALRDRLRRGESHP